MKTIWFLVTFLSLNSQLSRAESSLQSCRDRIAEIVCVVDPVDYNIPFSTQYNRPCLDVPGYADIFEKHFDQSKDLIKKMYCSLEKIWIENEVSTIAYATQILDNSNRLVAGAIGVSRKFLDEKPTFDILLSRKEAASFGSESIELFKYSSKLSINQNFAIFYVINHEFGHLFDYANKLNDFSNCDNDDCRPTVGSWGEISWLNNESQLEKNEFPLELQPCFYACNNFLDIKNSKKIFSKLLESDFPSTYASFNPKEDWAEMFALHLAVEENFDWQVETQGHKFDLQAHFYSSKLDSKRAFVQKFLLSSPRYPGE